LGSHPRHASRTGPDTVARLFDPAGLRPPIWFQEVPETKPGKNRLHLDLYPTGRDNALPLERRIEIVEAKVAELVALGGAVARRTRHDDPEDPSITWSCTIRRATSSAWAEAVVNRAHGAASRPSRVPQRRARRLLPTSLREPRLDLGSPCRGCVSPVGYKGADTAAGARLEPSASHTEELL